MVPELWGMKMFCHEDTIYRIVEYTQFKNREWAEQAKNERPIQQPWSRWAIDEVIGELKLDESSYANEIVQRFISRMRQYEDVAEPERKALYRTARNTVEELYSYLFGEKHEKENIPF